MSLKSWIELDADSGAPLIARKSCPTWEIAMNKQGVDPCFSHVIHAVPPCGVYKRLLRRAPAESGDLAQTHI